MARRPYPPPPGLRPHKPPPQGGGAGGGASLLLLTKRATTDGVRLDERKQELARVTRRQATVRAGQHSLPESACPGSPWIGYSTGGFTLFLRECLPE